MNQPIDKGTTSTTYINSRQSINQSTNQPIIEACQQTNQSSTDPNRPTKSTVQIVPGAAAGGLRGPRERFGRPSGWEMFPSDFEGRVGAVEGFSQPLQGRAGGAAGGVPPEDSSRFLAAGPFCFLFRFSACLLLLFWFSVHFPSLRDEPPTYSMPDK